MIVTITMRRLASEPAVRTRVIAAVLDELTQAYGDARVVERTQTATQSKVVMHCLDPLRAETVK